MICLKGKHNNMCNCGNVDNDDWYAITPLDNELQGDRMLIVYRNGKSLAENEIPVCLLAQYKDYYPGRKIIKIETIIDKHGRLINVAD